MKCEACACAALQEFCGFHLRLQLAQLLRVDVDIDNSSIYNSADVMLQHPMSRADKSAPDFSGHRGQRCLDGVSCPLSAVLAPHPSQPIFEPQSGSTFLWLFSSSLLE